MPVFTTFFHPSEHRLRDACGETLLLRCVVSLLSLIADDFCHSKSCH